MVFLPLVVGDVAVILVMMLSYWWQCCHLGSIAATIGGIAAIIGGIAAIIGGFAAIIVGDAIVPLLLMLSL